MCVVMFARPPTRARSPLSSPLKIPIDQLLISKGALARCVWFIFFNSIVCRAGNIRWCGALKKCLMTGLLSFTNCLNRCQLVRPLTLSMHMLSLNIERRSAAERRRKSEILSSLFPFDTKSRKNWRYVRLGRGCAAIEASSSGSVFEFPCSRIKSISVCAFG